MDNAIAGIGKAQDPLLSLVLDSHGGKGFVCRQNDSQKDIKHTELVNMILNKSKIFKDKYEKDLKINIIYDACYSETLINELKSRVNDQGSYDFKVSIITSASSRDYGYGNELLEATEDLLKAKKIIAETGEIPYTCSLEPEDIPILCNLDDKNTHQAWSSYKKGFDNEDVNADQLLKTIEKYSKTENINKPEIQRIIKSLLEKPDNEILFNTDFSEKLFPFLDSNNSGLKRSILKYYQQQTYSDKKVLDKIISIANKDPSDDIRIEALKSLDSHKFSDHPLLDKTIESALKGDNSNITSGLLTGLLSNKGANLFHKLEDQIVGLYTNDSTATDVAQMAQLNLKYRAQY